MSGTVGFAFGPIAIALLLPFGSVALLVPLILIGSTVSQVLAILLLRQPVDWRRLWPFLLPGILGVPLGTAALSRTDPHVFRVSLGVLLILFSLYGLSRGARPVTVRAGRGADAAIGFIGGVMGGYAGLSGILPTIWCGMRGWSRGEQRAVYQPFILAIQLCALAAGGASHVFAPSALLLAAVYTPVFLGGTLCGLWVYGKLDERKFRLAVLILLLVSGIAQLA